MKPALRYEGVTTSYRDLEGRVAALAGSLRQAGTGPGDRVAYLGPSCPELVEVAFACARLGVIFVPLNARMPPSELRVFVEQSEPHILLAEQGLAEVAYASAVDPATAVMEFVAGRGFGDPGAEPVAADLDAADTAPVFLLFTSGTTGVPKGAVITDRAVMAHAAATITGLEMSASDEVLTFTPMFHIAGLNLLTMPALCAGATVTIHPHFDPAAALAEVERTRSTLLLAPPAMTRQLAFHPCWDRTDLTSLRCVLTGGTTVTERSVRPWQERGVPVVQSYGMTETGGTISLSPIRDALASSLTAGTPSLGADVRVVDPSGQEVPVGSHGEIVVRGPSVMAEYFQNPEATAQTVRGGWLHTGDVGYVDDRRYLHVVDRLKEVIIVGVSNVSPADLEAVLAESSDIDAAAVVGRPDDELGEVPVAFVVPARGRALAREQVLALFTGRLATYKHPRDVVFVDALPATAVEKPDKQALRAIARALPRQGEG
jgi:fatty-acyl-CoA synthase